MARDLASHWYRDPDSVVEQGASAAAIAAAESQLGVRLPMEYRKLIGIQDGGILVAGKISLPQKTRRGNSTAAMMGGLFGIGGRPAYSILCTPSMIETWKMPSGLVLISGDGHRWFALDYRTCGPDGEPTVVWIDNDYDEVMTVAVTFGEFLNRLQADEDEAPGDDGIIESESFLDF